MKSTIRTLFFTMLFFNLACAEDKVADKAEDSKKMINSSNVEAVIKDDVNLVFLTTDWCSASKHILKETYTGLCDSLRESLNIVIICASEKNNRFDTYLKELGITCSYYLLPRKGHNEFFLEHPDRKRIRYFIKNNLKGYEGLKLQQQFGVPVGLFVNKKLEIISKAPQKVVDIMASVEKLRAQ